MSDKFLPFSKPTISQAAIDEVVACLNSGWVTTGPRTEKFEKMLQDYLGAPHALALNSATAGLHVALHALALKPGEEVITSAMTFVASLNTIVQAGGKPVLVDIDPLTYNIDPHQIEKAITSKTRAILPVHFTGLSADLEVIYDIAEKYHLRVIEDAAQAIGATYKNRRLGSFGDTQVFSFHPNKNMTTGEGGCITTRDPELAKQIKILRFHGIDRDAFNRFSKEGSQHYDVIAPGFKYNMLDMQAALGIHQLPELEGFNEKRRQLAEGYYALLKDWPQWTLPPAPHSSLAEGHAWHLYAPQINPVAAKMDRDTFIERMKENNIGLGLHYDPPHLYRYYREQFGYKEGDFPQAETLGKHIVSLPLFPSMTVADQHRVVDTMRKIFTL